MNYITCDIYNCGQLTHMINVHKIYIDIDGPVCILPGHLSYTGSGKLLSCIDDKKISFNLMVIFQFCNNKFTCYSL